MTYITYVERSYQPTARYIIQHARRICEGYAADGFDLTLRQLYYQFVSHDLFPDDWTWRQVSTSKWVRDPNGTKNAQPNYDKLGEIVSNARLSGDLSWDFIADRHRKLEENPHWRDARSVLQAAAQGFMVDRWAEQPVYVEAWIEKDSLIQVLETACPDLDVPYIACKGYMSQSMMWQAAQRIRRRIDDGKDAVIVHVGDHDPSGIDMTRDIHERLALFIAQDIGEMAAKTRQDELWEYTDVLGDRLSIKRVALNYDQVQAYNPPPNPAKLTDSRAGGYVERFGYKSWEVDALDVRTLAGLVTDAVYDAMDVDLMEETKEEEESQRVVLTNVSTRFKEVRKYFEDNPNSDYR